MINPQVFQNFDSMINKGFEAAGEKIQQAIDFIGEKLDQLFGAVRGLGKGGISIGNGSLAGGLNTAPQLSASNVSPTPSQGQSQSVERSQVPERVQEQVRAMPSSQAKGFEVANVSAQDFGTFSPTPVGVGGQQQSQGYGIG